MTPKRLCLLALFWAFASQAAVEVNTATVAELDGIKGIGPASSARILDARKNANFKDWGDLIQRVKGIKSSQAARLSAEGLTVNGQGYEPATRK